MQCFADVSSFFFFFSFFSTAKSSIYFFLNDSSILPWCTFLFEASLGSCIMFASCSCTSAPMGWAAYLNPYINNQGILHFSSQRGQLERITYAWWIAWTAKRGNAKVSWPSPRASRRRSGCPWRGLEPKCIWSLLICMVLLLLNETCVYACVRVSLLWIWHTAFGEGVHTHTQPHTLDEKGRCNPLSQSQLSSSAYERKPCSSSV